MRKCKIPVTYSETVNNDYIERIHQMSYSSHSDNGMLQILSIFINWLYGTLSKYYFFQNYFVLEDDILIQLLSNRIFQEFSVSLYSLVEFNSFRTPHTTPIYRVSQKHGNSVTNYISSFLWISIVIPNFKFSDGDGPNLCRVKK